MPPENGDNVFQRKILSIIILVSLYIFTGIFAQDRIINPFSPSSFFENIEYMVATGASIIFGGLIGAVVGAIGFFLLETILRIIGQETEPLGTAELIYAFAFFMGNWLTGYLSRVDYTNKTKFRQVIFSPKSWYNLIINTFSAILGVGIISNMIIAFFVSPSSFVGHITTFLTQFYFSFQLILVFIPVIIFLYNFVEVVRHKRANILDELYRDLDVEVDTDGPAEVIDVSFQDHALKIGKWTPINVKFKHTWKAGRSYDIETVSTSKIYPHKDTTSVLQEGEVWTHTFYVQALEQDHVDIRIRIHPAHTIKYKEKPKQQTLVSISGKTYIQRDLLLIGVFVFSEVVITLFLFSLLWNQLATIVIQEVFGGQTRVGSEISQFSVPWNLIGAIAIIEALLFIPFLLVMYRVQRPRVPQHIDEVLAFSQDIQTHKYKKDDKRTKLEQFYKYLLFPFSNAIFVILSGFLTFTLLQTSSEVVQNGTLPISPLEFNLLIIFTIVSWLITLLLLNKTSNRFDWKSSMSIESGKFISKVESLSQLKIHSPSEVLFEVKNVSKTPGLRIVFESNDAISPPILELHLDPGETAIFKTSLTPATRGTQEILAVIYPLFDDERNYLPIDQCKPVTSQNIQYKVLGETIIGITENQARTLRHLFGWGSLITSTMALANEYVGIEEAIQQWQETIPFLATIQIPFLYLYYLFSNRFLTDINAY